MHLWQSAIGYPQKMVYKSREKWNYIKKEKI